ncbi:undecaprenyl-diphosphate phosphatase [Halobium salinum]|uniref:Undecaprenyl-diphosphatase n=1 Tax=Halobium salinum TaxID=1364940 RepID=A0ABD5P823_9EURY|nr:undecaprenyl-diphosphate phosphatase [Halobium salinum]
MASVADRDLLVALVVGLVQGVVEWLPISSEGNVALALTLLGESPEAAVGYALFLHLGTGLSATVYFRDDIVETLRGAQEWRPGDAFGPGSATLSFVVLATLASGVTGALAYTALETLVSALTGGAFVALIGALLVATGVLTHVAGGVSGGDRDRPDLLDALLVGGLQGLAILPGVSRSGTTAGALLLRGHDGEGSFRLSFLLSVPAALGGAAIAVLDAGGLPALSPAAAVVSLAVAAVVGYLTVGALMKAARRLPFPAVCVALGALALVGGLAVGGVL